MTDSRQSEELQQLRQQMAEVTRRVFRLEQVLRTRIAVERGAEESAPARVESAQPEVPRAVAQASPTPSDSREAAILPDFREPQRIPQIPTPAANAEASDVSLETRIGGQWLNRIGIVAVLVGLSYFLKLAIENDWIGPATRVAIGLVAGIGLILWSERFRARLPGFRLLPKGHWHRRAVLVVMGRLPVLPPGIGPSGVLRYGIGHRKLSGHVADPEFRAAGCLCAGRRISNSSAGLHQSKSSTSHA